MYWRNIWKEGRNILNVYIRPWLHLALKFIKRTALSTGLNAQDALRIHWESITQTTLRGAAYDHFFFKFLSWLKYKTSHAISIWAESICNHGIYDILKKRWKGKSEEKERRKIVTVDLGNNVNVKSNTSKMLSEKTNFKQWQDKPSILEGCCHYVSVKVTWVWLQPRRVFFLFYNGCHFGCSSQQHYAWNYTDRDINFNFIVLVWFHQFHWVVGWRLSKNIPLFHAVYKFTIVY